MNIILLTKNKFKSTEIKDLIKGNGFKVEIFEDFKKLSNLEIINKLGYTECVLVREKTKLINKASKEISKEEHLEVVQHCSKLKVLFYKDNEKKEKEYSACIDGFIDLKRKQNKSNIYNWDDIFVSLKTMKTYYEMQNIRKEKCSARSHVVSLMLEDISYFDKKIDLNFNPFKQEEVIDFSYKIYDFIEKNEIIKKHQNSEILSKLINKVKNNGLFTRSSLNKKQRNYWYPSLNAGLPLVSKKDEIHEVTFMFHDLMHHLIPDLIHTGNVSKLHKEAYVIHRMLSESFTIVLADMVYIDELKKTGIDYDFKKRKIHPVYESMDIKELTIEKLKELIWANVNFALLGNESLLREKASKESVDDYVGKFKKFFIEDYRWTINNFDNMSSNKETIKKWFNTNKELIEKEGTIDYYSKLIQGDLKYSQKVEIIFNKVWNSIEYTLKKKEENFIKSKSTSEAFKRYMIGQSILFSKNELDTSTKTFKDLIYNELKKDCLFIEDIKKIRNFFNLYIDNLVDKNLIIKSEGDTYKEIVPLFEAYYVFYESRLRYNEINELLEDLLLIKCSK